MEHRNPPLWARIVASRYHLREDGTQAPMALKLVDGFEVLV
jgi:hypothetical protein